MTGDSGRTSSQLRAAGLLFVALTLCSCATKPTIPAVIPLPSDVSFNPGAGRDEWLIVNVHLEHGEELPFMVDTGTSVTLFDKTLEPMLGKRRGSTTFWNFSVKSKAGIHDAPRLYLGNTLLRTGRQVYTSDFKKLSRETGKPVMGVLGMDCLGNYSVQLDFESARMRFLDPEKPAGRDLGDAFPLSMKGGYPFIHDAGFLNRKEIDLMIDTGCIFDGLAKASRFPSNIKSQTGVSIATCAWNNNTYTNLFIKKEQPEVIGLRFLARHLVTLNFPGHKMYLKQESVGPLIDSDLEAATRYLTDLQTNGQVPGWNNTEKGTINLKAPPIFGKFQFVAQKEGDSSFYYYIVTRTSEDGLWKLQRAVRANQSGRIVQEYPIP